MKREKRGKREGRTEGKARGVRKKAEGELPISLELDFGNVDELGDLATAFELEDLPKRNFTLG